MREFLSHIFIFLMVRNSKASQLNLRVQEAFYGSSIVLNPMRQEHHCNIYYMVTYRRLQQIDNIFMYSLLTKIVKNLISFIRISIQ